MVVYGKAKVIKENFSVRSDTINEHNLDGFVRASVENCIFDNALF